MLNVVYFYFTGGKAAQVEIASKSSAKKGGKAKADAGSAKKGKVPTLKIKFGGKKGRKSGKGGGSSEEEEEEEEADSDAEFEEMLKVKADKKDASHSEKPKTKAKMKIGNKNKKKGKKKKNFANDEAEHQVTFVVFFFMIFRF